ncbi:MAG TPA: flagellar export chaperone FlgN [Candidatus Acidoferrales bacterium]|jgi:flagellar biosynthesis/type III secretory pathway chaperone|nr:flagellar export chaperone FlgN [Candidatus Acidoferrales bacterium]
MKELLSNLIESLREELKQYGEMLALLDQQQQLVTRRQTTALPDNVNHINAQAEVLAGARAEREQRQRNLARSLELPENTGFKVLIPKLPPDYQPLIDALVAENNELLVRVQARARQNHLLLSHCVDLMAQLIHSIFPATKPVMYNGNGQAPGIVVPAQSLYQAVG